jgi:ferredoxin
MRVGTVSVDPARCIRCGSCSILAPDHFDVSGRGSQVARQPTTDDEIARVRAALLICPTSAIQLDEARAP